MRLYYAGLPGKGYGWGCCNENLIAELSKRCELSGPFDYIREVDPADSDIAFMPLADHDFNPISLARGKVNLAYTFFEFPLGPHAAENAKKYNTVFAGSSWCLERMAEAGITNGKLLIQGVDQSIFSPQPQRKPDGQFRIFSGGKFEYRKGQDLVIAAFEKFSKRHNDAHLICSWFNPWPDLIEGMNQTDVIKWAKIKSNTGAFLRSFPDAQYNLFGGILSYSFVGYDRNTILRQCSHSDLAFIMADTDIGLFPNRCEGGTNLVLMEYASCGRKIVANAKTGHADVAGAISYEIPATTDDHHWAVQSVEDIVAMLELAYENRETPEHHSLKAIRDEWTWGRAAETIIAEAQRFL